MVNTDISKLNAQLKETIEAVDAIKPSLNIHVRFGQNWEKEAATLAQMGRVTAKEFEKLSGRKMSGQVKPIIPVDPLKPSMLVSIKDAKMNDIRHSEKDMKAALTEGVEWLPEFPLYFQVSKTKVKSKSK